MKKAFIGFLSFIAPSRLAKFAYHMLTHPQVKKLRPRELEFMETGERKTLLFQKKDLVTYFWPNTGPKIMLIHGWEGQAGNFTDVIQRLHKSGFSIITFDAPAHGLSEAGSTTLWAFGDAVMYMMEQHNPRYLLSHSFGGVATVYALKNLASNNVRKYLLLCPPDSFNERIDQVAESVGITEKVKEKLKDKLRAEVDEPLEELSVSNYVKDFSIPEVCILHDQEDRVVPIAQSLRVASNWKNATHQTIHGTGHFRILRDEEVLSLVTAFFSEKE